MAYIASFLVPLHGIRQNMKRFFTVMVLGLLLTPAVQAQINRYGVSVGFGTATLADDLSTKSPILGMNIGGFIEYDFGNMRSILTDRFYLRTGLNFARRGHNFEEIYEMSTSMSYRLGSIHAWYAQIPVLACFRYELPVRTAGHYVNAYVGPSFSFGLFGAYRDRKVSPYMPQDNMNYDTYVTEPDSERKTFNHISRPDVSVIFGLGYGHKSTWAVDLIFDYGFLATSVSSDALKTLEKQQLENGTNYGSGDNGSNNNGNSSSNNTYGHVVTDPKDVRTKVPNGNNVAVLLQLTYKLPVIRTN